MKLKNHNGPTIYKSELGLPAYKNSDNQELYLLNFKFDLQDLKENGTLKEEGDFFLFDGYASTWTLDLGDDIIQQGAFTESLKKRKPKVLAFHDPDIIAGFSDEEFEDDIGLRVRGRIPKNGGNTDMIVPYMGPGGLESLSIGFRIARNDKNEPEMDFINGIRIIKKIELFEYSFVTFPMNPAAKVGLLPEEEDDLDDDGIPKNNDLEDIEINFETIREAEKCLTEFGLKSGDAKTIISKIKEMSNTRDDEDDDIGDDKLSPDNVKLLMEALHGPKVEALSQADIDELAQTLKSMKEV